MEQSLGKSHLLLPLFIVNSFIVMVKIRVKEEPSVVDFFRILSNVSSFSFFFLHDGTFAITIKNKG